MVHEAMSDWYHFMQICFVLLLFHSWNDISLWHKKIERRLHISKHSQNPGSQKRNDRAIVAQRIVTPAPAIWCQGCYYFYNLFSLKNLHQNHLQMFKSLTNLSSFKHPGVKRFAKPRNIFVFSTRHSWLQEMHFNRKLSQPIKTWKKQHDTSALRTLRCNIHHTQSNSDRGQLHKNQWLDTKPIILSKYQRKCTKSSTFASARSLLYSVWFLALSFSGMKSRLLERRDVLSRFTITVWLWRHSTIIIWLWGELGWGLQTKDEVTLRTKYDSLAFQSFVTPSNIQNLWIDFWVLLHLLLSQIPEN